MNETPLPKGPRCFVAVPLPAEIRQALGAAIDPAGPLGGALPDVRWQRKSENLHVTLSFLGNVPDGRVRALVGAMPALVAGITRFPITVRGLGAFASARRANVIWAGVEDPAGALARIAALFAGESDPREAGRPFRAHVTLGRCKTAVDARPVLARLADTTFGSATVAEVHLYESRLGRQGSTYTILGRGPLAGAPVPTR
jgi:RNA 2',3'-cyclic 3'-phosphodiesterase